MLGPTGAEGVSVFSNIKVSEYLILNILLRSILDADEAQTELNLLVHNHALGVRSSVHNVDLRDDTDGPDALGINSAGHSETLLRGHIRIGCDNAENDRS